MRHDPGNATSRRADRRSEEHARRTILDELHDRDGQTLFELCTRLTMKEQALVDDGIPYTSFAVDNVDAEYDRLRARGIRFTQEPLEMQSELGARRLYVPTRHITIE